MAPGTPGTELRRIGDLWVRVDRASANGGYRTGGDEVPTIVAMADRTSTLWSIAAGSGFAILWFGFLIALSYWALFAMNGAGAGVRVLVLGLALGFSVFGGRILVPAIRESLRQLRQPVVFQLDAQSLKLEGQVHPRESIREIVVEHSAIDGSTFRVVARTDDASLWLAYGLENEKDARWLEAQIGVPGDSSSGSDGRRRS